MLNIVVLVLLGVHLIEGSPRNSDTLEQDDVIVSHPRLLAALNEKQAQTRRVKRQVFSDDDYWWPTIKDSRDEVIRVEVPYTEQVDHETLQRAIEVFNTKTCIRFVPRGIQPNYVHFVIGARCSAGQVGYQNNSAQLCTLTDNCSKQKGKILHEMMHILGFMHEQCRPDRDSYVTVNTQNIQKYALQSYEIVYGADYGIPYDCDSILHYKDTAFAKSGLKTMTSTKCSNLGNDDTRLSLLDYKRINTVYKCPDNPDYRYFKVKVETGTGVWAGTDCYVYLTLHGARRTSGKFELDISEGWPTKNIFEKGNTDIFSHVAYRDDLGTIKGISVWMEPNSIFKDWNPVSFTISDPVNNEVVKFTSSTCIKPSILYGQSYFTEHSRLPLT